MLGLDREEERAGESTNVLDAGDESRVGVGVILRIEVAVAVSDQPPNQGET